VPQHALLLAPASIIEALPSDCLNQIQKKKNNLSYLQKTKVVGMEKGMNRYRSLFYSWYFNGSVHRQAQRILLEKAEVIVGAEP